MAQGHIVCVARRPDPHAHDTGDDALASSDAPGGAEGDLIAHQNAPEDDLLSLRVNVANHDEPVERTQTQPPPELEEAAHIEPFSEAEPDPEQLNSFSDFGLGAIYSVPESIWTHPLQEFATAAETPIPCGDAFDTNLYAPTSFSEGGKYSDVIWLPPYEDCLLPTTFVPNENIDWSYPFGVVEPGIRHVDILPDPGLQCQLIEHWNLHLCDALGPVPGMHNPLRTVVLPLALEGAKADSRASTGAIALFHLICSASAFHLSKVKTEPESKRAFEALGLEHHNLGITHLSRNIQTREESQCVSILASIQMCLYNEAITVPTPFWRLHLHGAVEWVNHIDHRVWHQTESASVIYQLFMATAVFLQAQLLPDTQYMWDVHYDLTLQTHSYILEGTYGLPESLLQGINSMNSYQVKAQKSESLSTSRETDMQSCLDRLELELLLSAPKRATFRRDQQHEDLVYHHAYTYYYAAVIYLKRTLRKVPLEEVQSLVEESLQYMEGLITITDRPFSPVLWPIAIIAFETHQPVLQNRVLKCLNSFANRSRLTIWEKLSDTVKELWAQRALGCDANARWHSCLPLSSKDAMMLF